MDSIQKEVTQQMRGILVDWLVEVAEEYNLKGQTLFLAVSYVDRVLESTPVSRSILQLVGITCMLIACKYEEIYAPLVEQFVYITDNTYTKEEILRTELVVLNTLKFKLTTSTVKNFLVRFLSVTGAVGPQVIAHANYLAEMSLPVYSIHKNYRPSQLAAAIACISKHTFSQEVWSPVFESYTSFSRQDLQKCICEIYQVHSVLSASPPGKLTAATEKYRQPEYFCVANIPLPATLPLI